MSETRGFNAGPNSRPLNDTLAETGPGVPDDSVGPEQRTIPDQIELSESAQAEAIARKLQAEVDARYGRHGSEDADLQDPAGHA